MLAYRFEDETYQLDWRAAMIASTIANTTRGKDDPAYTPEMFIAGYDNQEDEEEKTEEQMLSVMRALFPPRPQQGEDG